MGKLQEYEQVGVAVTCRSFDEYARMFALRETDLVQGPILDVAGGASSFTAEANRRGYEAVAADPSYVRDAEQFQSETLREIEQSTAKLSRIREQYDWSYYGSLDKHRERRLRSARIFHEDYKPDIPAAGGEAAAGAGRGTEGSKVYVAAALPELPFADDTFSLVLCSHFLFLYADQFGERFHREAVRELVRVCRPGGEVRIYPLLSLRWETYPGLESLVEELILAGHRVNRTKSGLPFIPGSDEMLRIGKLGGQGRYK